MNTLEEKLKAAKSAGSPAAGLHSSIMNAVRAAAEAQAPRARPFPPRWLVAAGAASVVLLGAWAMGLLPAREHRPVPPLQEAESALAAGHGFAGEVPAVVLAPMLDELAAVERDFRNAVEHLLASVP